MPLIRKIAAFLRQGQAEAAPTFCVGTVGNARIRAVASYGKTGFEVSWQVVPARTVGSSGHGDRRAAADQVALARAVGA